MSTPVITRAQLAEYRRTGMLPQDRPAPPVATGPPQTEDEIHRDVVAWLGALGTRLRAIPIHCPNEGKRRKVTGGRLVGLGMLKGAADLIFLSGVVMPGCWCLELKDHDGKLSAAQVSFAKRCAGLGVPFEVARSLGEAQAVVRKWGLVNP